ncbi:MAG: glycosyltransferase [Patescibacteria group bacterium]
MKNIAIVVHKYLPQPDDDLAYFLNRKKNINIFHIKHSFSDAKDRCSVLRKYLNGLQIDEIKTLDYKFLPEVLIYIKEFIFTVKWLILTNKKFDLYIGMDGLCTLFGLFLQKFRICKKVVYWNMDFVPFNRFEYKWKNVLYNKVNSYACKKADEVWDISPRMEKGRKQYLDVYKKDYKMHRVMPYGVWTHQIKTISYEKSQKHTLVFMGHLLKKQGVDMIIKKIPDILIKIPDFEFKIIGDGNYKDQLIRLADILSVHKYCKFLGRLDDFHLNNEIAKASISIAPYSTNKYSYTYYADPGKIKKYLACGVPVLLTNLSWNTHEIEKNECGLIIGDNGNDLVDKLLYLFRPKINEKFRKNAIKYSKSFDYEKIFSELNI